MNITIIDLEANASLEAQAMSTLVGGCCYYQPPVCCHYQPPCNWWGSSYKPYFKMKRVRFDRKNGKRRLKGQLRLRA